MSSYTVYLFITASGSHYRVTAHPDVPSRHGRSTLRLEKEISLGEHRVIVDDLEVCPPELWVGDQPVFEGSYPTDRDKSYWCRTSPVTYVNHAVTRVLD